VEVSDAELEEAAQAAIEAINESDLARVRDYLRAAELARAWLTSCHSSKRLTPFRCFVLGYLAAVQDRV
jgi:hypothetical protein